MITAIIRASPRLVSGLFRKLVLGMVMLGGVSMVEPALSIAFATAGSGSTEVVQATPGNGPGPLT